MIFLVILCIKFAFDAGYYKGYADSCKETIEEVVTVNKGKKKQSSMSVRTATGLSLGNLFSKLKRTILVTIAGSIGIIGVSAVLAVSQGVKDFIGDMQDDMLSSYPIEIAEESVDYTSLMSGLSADTASKALKEFDVNTQVGVDSMINYLMTAYSDITSVKTNTINDELVDYVKSVDPESAASIHEIYSIDPTNSIFGSWQNNFGEKGHTDVASLNGLTQSYIAELKTVEGFKSYASYVDLFTGFMNELPCDTKYLENQYDLIAGSKFAEKEDEMMLVVDQNTTLTDLLLAEMGIYDHDEFINIAKLAIKKNEIPDDLPKAEKEAKIRELEEKYPYTRVFNFDDLINRDFYYYPQQSLWHEPSEGKVADDKQTASVIVMKTTVVSTSPLTLMITSLYNLTYDDTDSLSGTYLSMGSGSSIEFKQLNFVRQGEFTPDFTDMKSNVAGKWISYTDEGKPDVTIDFGDGTPGVQPKIYLGESETEDISGTYAATKQNVTTVIEGYNYNAFATEDMVNNPQAYNTSIILFWLL